MKVPKVIITGANGLLGNAISTDLHNHFEVTKVARFSKLNEPDFDINTIFVDLAEFDFKTVVKKINPDYIIHCAARIPSHAIPDDEQIYNYNWKIDKNVFSCVKEIDCKLIYISSTAVYNEFGNEIKLTETSRTGNSSFYAKQKIEAEHYISSYLPKSWVLRINAPYGAMGRTKTVINLFVESALQNIDLYLYGTGNRKQDFTHIFDIAFLIRTLILNNNIFFGIYNISSGNPVSMKELSQMVIRITKSKSNVLYKPQSDPQENYKAMFCTKKAVQFLNWHPNITIEQGINELAKNFK